MRLQCWSSESRNKTCRSAIGFGKGYDTKPSKVLKGCKQIRPATDVNARHSLACKVNRALAGLPQPAKKAAAAPPKPT